MEDENPAERIQEAEWPGVTNIARRMAVPAEVGVGSFGA